MRRLGSDPYPLFFFNDAATTEIYTLSLHDALPICAGAVGHRRAAPLSSRCRRARPRGPLGRRVAGHVRVPQRRRPRSEEHTSELQSRQYLVCRLLLEKKTKSKGRHDIRFVPYALAI